MTPVQDKNESSEEWNEDAEVAVTPDPDGEGEEHYPDGGDVCETVQEDHPVHQRVLLYLEPDKDHDIDDKDCEIISHEHYEIKQWHFPIWINKNCFSHVQRKI